MMCDELKPLMCAHEPNVRPMYGKYEVDEAIAELKAENAQLKKEIEFMHSNCKWYAGDGCARLLGEKLAIINENVELKAKLDKAIAERDGNQVCIDALKQKLESVQASMYCDVVDANMENRRLRRALWIARAERALEKIAWFKLWNASISTMNPEDGARQEFDKWKKNLGKWKKNLGKFLKNAEAYK